MSPLSYSYGAVANATLDYDDEIDSEKLTKCNENNLMSFCLAIIID